jgi:iron complex transport system substrate-binding protein
MRVPGLRRRRTVFGATALAFLALTAVACGGSTSSGASGSAKSASTADQTHYPLTITQPDGKTAVIKSAPTRIVTVDNADPPVEYLEALGVAPIGGTEYSYTGASAQVYGPLGISPVIHLTSYQNFGKAPGSADLEAIAAAHPDLIVGDMGKSTADISQLEAIAPVVDLPENAPPGNGLNTLPWYPSVELLAKVLNRQAQANAFIAKFEAAAAKVRPELKGKTVSVVTPLLPGGTTLYADGPALQNNKFLEYLGLTIEPLPAGVPSPGGEVSGPLSLERATELTGEYLEINAYSPESLALNQSLLKGPIFSRLASVKAGRVLDSIGPTFGGIYPHGAVSELAAIPAVAAAFENTGTAP